MDQFLLIPGLLQNVVTGTSPAYKLSFQDNAPKRIASLTNGVNFNCGWNTYSREFRAFSVAANGNVTAGTYNGLTVKLYNWHSGCNKF